MGPYAVTLKTKTEKKLTAMTFIDLATGWFEVVECFSKDSAHMSQTLQNVWLSRYPRPEGIIFDNGTKFKKDFQYIFDDYGVAPRPTTIKNPQVNAILERVHQVLSNILCCKNITNLDLNPKDPWSKSIGVVAGGTIACWRPRAVAMVALRLSSLKVEYAGLGLKR